MPCEIVLNDIDPLDQLLQFRGVILGLVDHLEERVVLHQSSWIFVVHYNQVVAGYRVYEQLVLLSSNARVNVQDRVVGFALVYS